jgi:hypothetical protein
MNAGSHRMREGLPLAVALHRSPASYTVYGIFRGFRMRLVYGILNH